MNLLVVLDVDQQLRDRYAQLRMNDLRRDLAQGNQNELSAGHLGVGNPQIFLFYDGAVIEQDIKIDDARAPALFDFFAPHRPLDVLEFQQQRVGFEFGFDLDGAVDIPVLGVAQGFAFVERGLLEDLGIRQFGQTVEGLQEVFFLVADVGTDPDVNLMGNGSNHSALSRK